MDWIVLAKSWNIKLDLITIPNDGTDWLQLAKPHGVIIIIKINPIAIPNGGTDRGLDCTGLQFLTAARI